MIIYVERERRRERLLERIVRSEPFQDLFHPWRENRKLRLRIQVLEDENEELATENRDYKKGFGIDKEVMLATGNARYWSRKWSDLFEFTKQNCRGCDKIPREVWKDGSGGVQYVD